MNFRHFSLDALAPVLKICNLEDALSENQPATRFTAQILSLCKLTLQKENLAIFLADNDAFLEMVAITSAWI